MGMSIMIICTIFCEAQQAFCYPALALKKTLTI